MLTRGLTKQALSALLVASVSDGLALVVFLSRHAKKASAGVAQSLGERGKPTGKRSSGVGAIGTLLIFAAERNDVEG